MIAQAGAYTGTTSFWLKRGACQSRRAALNLLRAETSVKDSLQGKRMRVSLDNDYMLKVLAAAVTLE